MNPLIQKIAATCTAALLIGGGTSVWSTTGRLSVLEAQRTEDVNRLTRIEAKIDHFENKIDRLLEHNNAPSN